MVWVWCLAPLLLCGCYTYRVSETPRTATEQLLLSRAAEQAMKGVDVNWLQGKKIFVEDKYFESYDKGYAVGVLRERFSRYGALLTSTNDKADVIVEIQSGSLAMNTSSLLIGIPTITVPLPFTGPIATPELAFYKSEKADGIAKFTFFAYARESGNYVSSSGPDSGKSHFYKYKLIFITWQRTDIPELKKEP
ncbi:MAG TPA: DUF6655 family protein [Verrucomicrobiae bacterium]|jgi:hypothetical protein|nr:DUF6655 family protein [Verrucomicrobiae bacterium]